MTDREPNKPPITVPLRFLHAFLGGRVTFLNFCRSFEWVDSEVEARGVNPFSRYEQDNLQISSIEINDGGSEHPTVTFHFKPDSRLTPG
ncbi:hypothetical protein [Brevundimonas guildfordensis]|uniref:Uncharacterized protein n=1 Tax=Brevundimonas guildfordensis TaxID=2762241 RepID=A0ABR8R3Y5_9CAUL|nr:hypothetical protein [Brevundimonas guildfordensis]MBD7942484.1 hypothetical protein [Brevundimonas guildfordensis]